MNGRFLISLPGQFIILLSVKVRYLKNKHMRGFPVFLLLMICFSSCKKDPDTTPIQPGTPPPTGYTIPLTTGSYWIYERFNLDTNGVETVIAVDSSYISGDTIIGENTFSIFVGTVIDPAGIYFRRDSLGCLVDQSGIVRFSKTNFTDTLWSGTTPGYYSFNYKMVPEVLVPTPSGSLNACDFLGTIQMLSPTYPWGTPRYVHSYFSDGIGLIRETTFFVSSPNYIGRKLLRYHIQ